MRVLAKPLNKYPWLLRPFFWNQKRKYGAVLQPGLLWARVPKLFTAVAILYGVLDRKSSQLCPVLRSLVTVRVSQINDCDFCVDINSATLAKRASSFDKVVMLNTWKESDFYDEKEKTVLEYTEAVTYSNRRVTDELMMHSKTFFDDDGIIELTGLIAFQNMSSKFNSALAVPPQGFCNIPERNTVG